MAGAVRLYLIPGAGTDRRLLTPQLNHFPQLTVPTWLAPAYRHEPLIDYAMRMAEQIDTSQPFVLGGVSLGGMIALEMAARLQPLGVILIASAASSHAVSGIYRAHGKCMRALPDALVKAEFAMMAKGIEKFVAKRHRSAEPYAQMLRDMDPTLTRWQSGAASEWTLSRPLSVPVFHIHGGKDPIIPLKNVTPQAIIDEGGHLINVTHDTRVNAFIERCLQGLAVSAAS